MRKLRTAIRLARAGVHLGYGSAVVAVIYPLVPLARRRALKQRWSRQLLRLLGVRLTVTGTAPDGAALVVANHVSWLDIFALNAVLPIGFVCKDDVRRWPVIGWLCARTETVFIERGSAAAARRTAETIAARLRQNHVLGVFPEGTTGDGDGLLPFRSALLQAAADARVPLQPFALRYLDRSGQRTKVAAYCGDTTLWRSLCAVAGSPGIELALDVLPAIESSGRTRRQLAAEAEKHIGLRLASSAALGRCHY
ncbi:MAG: lysophospholipid acyltransferase family protein [Pseudomonadota bacterium]|jgi:1-acyl-sn-glycerol-3-phosphate acyltransferase